MDNIQKNLPMTWIKYGLFGFLVGICLVALSTAGLFAVQVANPPPKPTLLPTPTIAARGLLDSAREALFDNEDAQFVIDNLKPHLEEFTDPQDHSEALQYLYMAEMRLGHYQLAAAYLERLNQIAPSAENYATLGRMYDAAGDLEHALANYLLLLKSDDSGLTDDVRQMVQERVNQIQSVLTSFTPTPEP
jgi:tetratricopeptide (TPR) repeat protein